eukprot:14689687-Alexandrium_andersonii.AAC.1
MEYLQNHLGLPHHATQPPKPACGFCNATKQGGVDNRWLDFRPRTSWHTASSVATNSHPLTNVVGWSVWHFTLDWMHIVDLGIASYGCANILFDIVFNKLSHLPRAAAVNTVAELLSTEELSQGGDFDRLELHHFCNPKKPHQEHPTMHHLKAAHIRGLVGKLPAVFQKYCGKSMYDSVQKKMIVALATFYETMHEGDMFFNDTQWTRFQKASTDFLLSYNWLASQADTAGKVIYNVVPKHHYFYHLMQQSRYMNPRFCWCYGGEDLVGRASSLAHSCTKGTPPAQVPAKMMLKYRVAKQLQWSRQ